MQGGIGPAGLASEDLHVLDFADLEKPRWHRHALSAGSWLRLLAWGGCAAAAWHRPLWLHYAALGCSYEASWGVLHA